MFAKIKRFYDLGLYTKAQVHVFVEKSIITEHQYLEIVENKTIKQKEGENK